MCSCLVIVMKTWANGGDGVSALALLAEVSGAVPVAFTVATIKKKIQCVQRFLQRLYGFTEYLQPGWPVTRCKPEMTDLSSVLS